MDNESELIQLEYKDLSTYRENKHKEQNEICPLLGLKFPISEMVVDHKHKLKADKPSLENGGLVRGVIQFQANVMEGKISSGWKRYGLHKHGVSLPTYLRNLADYLENSITNLIHPNEKPKVKKIQLSCYKKLVKAVNGKYKIPPYPKEGGMKLTKPMKVLFEKYNVPIRYYGDKPNGDES